MRTKVNLRNIHPSKVFYGYIYPLLAKDFLFGSDYDTFADKVKDLFDLTFSQWDAVLEEWELKEQILSI